MESKLRIGVVLFDGFELLDVFGPLEFFLSEKRLFDSVMLAKASGRVESGQGPVVFAEQSLSDCEEVDVLMIPGGMGTRREIQNQILISEIFRLSKSARFVCSICTGSALLAKTGLLDGRKATSNKAAWKWVTSQREEVRWIPKARWVQDGKFFTSSGVSAGMDMALALIAEIFDEAESRKIAEFAEYQWNSDPSWDPFAKIHGLSSD